MNGAVLAYLLRRYDPKTRFADKMLTFEQKITGIVLVRVCGPFFPIYAYAYVGGEG